MEWIIGHLINCPVPKINLTAIVKTTLPIKHDCGTIRPQEFLINTHCKKISKFFYAHVHCLNLLKLTSGYSFHLSGGVASLLGMFNTIN
jgi:hypothetical protein